MAFLGASSVFLLFCVFVVGARAATFTITNNCSFTMWPAAIPVGGGLQLNPGQVWTFDVPVGSNAGRIWGRTGCSFNGSSSGHCATGDCSGELSCSGPGNSPTTEAEFAITTTNDYYDISLIDGYNLPMDFSCSTGRTLKCREPRCSDAFLFPDDGGKVSECKSNSNYQVTFCP